MRRRERATAAGRRWPASKEITAALGIPFIFKSSFDKANRSSSSGFRGFGLERRVAHPGEVRRQIGVPVLTVHNGTKSRMSRRWSTCCKRRRCLRGRRISSRRSRSSGKPVNMKKGQFMAPGDMWKNVVAKAKEANGGADSIMVCERGVSFGYNNR